MNADLLQPNSVVDAAAEILGDLALDRADIVSGAPSAGLSELLEVEGGGAGALGVGIWELGVGTVTDTEVDEVFVVIAGSAVIEIVGTDRMLRLAPGTVGRLAAGTRTRWTVTETLRKVYVTLPGGSGDASATDAVVADVETPVAETPVAETPVADAPVVDAETTLR